MKRYFAVCLFFVIANCHAWAETIPVDDAFQQELKTLQSLREQNPDAYRKTIEDKKMALRAHIRKIKSQGASPYQDFIEQQKKERLQNFKMMKEKNPEAFQKALENKKMRIQELKKKNPKEFNRIAKRYPSLVKNSSNQKRTALSSGAKKADSSISKKTNKKSLERVERRKKGDEIRKNISKSSPRKQLQERGALKDHVNKIGRHERRNVVDSSRHQQSKRLKNREGLGPVKNKVTPRNFNSPDSGVKSQNKSLGQQTQGSIRGKEGNSGSKKTPELERARRSGNHR